jgi:hypothetical protein
MYIYIHIYIYIYIYLYTSNTLELKHESTLVRGYLTDIDRKIFDYIQYLYLYNMYTFNYIFIYVFFFRIEI